MLTLLYIYTEDKIGPEGMMNLFAQIGVNPVSIEPLIFAWKLEATVPCEFTRPEFTEGCLALGADTLEKLRVKMGTLKDALKSAADFRKFYMYAFDYNKPPEQRTLPLDTAKQLFPLLLEGRFSHLALWLEFLHTRNHPISKDSYALLLDFASSINKSMSNYDDVNGAWPILLDEFVDFARPKLLPRGTAASNDVHHDQDSDSSEDDPMVDSN